MKSIVKQLLRLYQSIVSKQKTPAKKPDLQYKSHLRAGSADSTINKNNQQQNGADTNVHLD